MVVEAEIKKLIDSLVDRDISVIEINGHPVTVRIFTDASRLSLTTLVHRGDGELSPGVRQAVGEKHPHELVTGLVVDEAHSEVYLHYIGFLEDLSHRQFSDLLDQFHEIAMEWRDILDDHDRRDYIRIHVR